MYKSSSSDKSVQTDGDMEQLIELTTKPYTKCITNDVHINIASFRSSHKWSSFCCERPICCCSCRVLSMLWDSMLGCCQLLLLLIVLSIIAAIILAILYGGYLVVLEGIGRQSYANSFDITGECNITHAEEKETESEDCTKDANGHETCTSSTSYTSYYDFYVSTNNNFTTFPCRNGSSYSASESGQLKYSKGDLINCYTNDKCHDVYMNKQNVHHVEAIGIFIGAALIFCVDLCCVAGFCIALGYGGLFWIVSCWDAIHGHQCRIFCVCICFECYDYHQERKEEKDQYYKLEWNKLGGREQCDYILGNWIRNDYVSCANVVNNDVADIVVKYYE